MRLVRLAGYINSFLWYFGLRLNRAPAWSERRRMRLIETRNISVVIDVGANVGQYALQLRRMGYKGWIYSYEPLPDAFQRLQARSRSDPRWRVFRLAVGDSLDPVTLQVASNSESSSILDMAKRHLDAEPAARFVSSVEVPSTTLDRILGELPAEPTLLKIDTQGYEGRVLAGAANSLHRVELLEIELSFFEVYVGQPLFREVDSLLLAAGFELTSLAEGEAFFDPHTGELLQLDGIYARRRGAAPGRPGGRG
jgi:FkbM family methyltransferase